MDDCTKSAEYLCRNTGRRTVRHIKRYGLSAEAVLYQILKIHLVDLFSLLVIKTPSQIFAGSIRNLRNLSIDVFFHLDLDFFFQFMTGAIDDLNSIIGIRIVTCRDHNTKIKILLPDQVRNARCRRNMYLIDIGSACCQTCCQCRLIHISGQSCIFSYKNPYSMIFILIIVSQKTSNLKSMFCRQRDICLAAEAIGTKILHDASPFTSFPGAKSPLETSYLIYTIIRKQFIQVIFSCLWQPLSAFFLLLVIHRKCLRCVDAFAR